MDCWTLLDFKKFVVYIQYNLHNKHVLHEPDLRIDTDINEFSQTQLITETSYYWFVHKEKDQHKNLHQCKNWILCIFLEKRCQKIKEKN